MNKLQEEVEVIENSKFRNLRANNYTKQALYNTIELLKSKIYKTSEKFKKSLQLQAEVISTFYSDYKKGWRKKIKLLYLSQDKQAAKESVSLYKSSEWRN